jgi:hypothetical protein
MSWIPPIDPAVLEQGDRMAKAARRSARRRWFADHAFDLFNSFLALVALIVAIFGLYLPQG